MRKASQKLWIGLALVTLGLLSAEMAVQAEESRPPRPSDFWAAEFWAGELGAIIGGSVGQLLCYYSEFSTQRGFIDCDHLHRVLTGRDVPDFLGIYHTFFGLNLGRALGASTGVVLAGMLFGVEGNIWAAYGATGLWFVATLYAEYSVLLMVPFVPALVATIGYNWGAKMQADTTKPAAVGWRLPLIAWRF